MIINKIVQQLTEDDFPGAVNVGISPDNMTTSIENGSVHELGAGQDPDASKPEIKNIEAAKNNQPGTPGVSSSKKRTIANIKMEFTDGINGVFSAVKGTSVQDEVKRELNSIIEIFNKALEKKNESKVDTLK